MTLKKRKAVVAITIAVCATTLIASLIAVSQLYTAPKDKTASVQASESDPTDSPAPPPSSQPDDYTGQDVAVGSSFTVKVPNGWRASVSAQQSFLAIQFARPGKLESLVYDKNTPPAVDHNGIPSWDGLTEHFYIRGMTAPAQVFKPENHAEVISESFTFYDGTVGERHSVTKHSSEATKWGGLLKDNEWYGRVYVYKKDGKSVEAHLAYYPSTKIDPVFYEKVAKSIH